MPHFFRAIRRPPIKQISEGDLLIQEARRKLEGHENAAHLLYLISQRQQAFYNQIGALKKESDKQTYIYAYIHFARNLKEYIDNPRDVDERISQYHCSPIYYNVGGKNNEFSYTFGDEMASLILTLSICFLLASLLTLPINLAGGLIILSVCVALLGPSLYYNLAVTRPNTLSVQKEETELFLATQDLLDPQVRVDEEEQIDPDSLETATMK
ncbi:hypothetical protein BN59_03421 [Legionella massiliensis]|uniref:Uncharacterized protein n=1 Tax=Legionella massiliensis TaxID=1034943 RepID=A0A078L4U8_9GAMM|nr:hypothetical protein [Legionella massiliensis]CDZ79104.1 hypothetical protein BN59_03421 [Legionella massiliensis]CEE14842.1 hypothetical protein BN1094_03421 [Legionella massiliensis]